MEIDFNKEHWEQKKCPQYDCRKKQCECGLEKVFLSAALGDDSKDSPVAPKNGEYCNAIVVYEANGHIYIYSQEGIPTLVESEGSNVEEIIEQLERRLNQEVLDRQAADNVLQGEIDDIKNSPDVVDIVATYAALQAYDTSKLGDNDVIRVLQDEQHDGQSTYYRWNKQSSTWTYIGAVGDYYTKGQVDTLLADKQDKLTAGANITIDANNEISATDTTYSDFTGATIQQAGTSGLVPAPTTSDPDKYLKGDGSWGTPTGTTYTAGTNVQISSGNVISATDTTYSDFTGTDGVTAGTAGLVPAPLTTDAGKFLKADGTWDTAGGGNISMVKTLTSDDYNYPTTGTKTSICLGELDDGFYKWGSIQNDVYVGRASNRPAGRWAYVITTNTGSSPVLKYIISGKSGSSTYAGADDLVIHFYNMNNGNSGALSHILSSERIEDNLTSTSTVYPLSANQGKVLKDLIDGLVISGAGAPTTSTVGTVGKLYEDTTNGKLYQCTAVNGSTYTWTEIGAGGGGGGGVTKLTSADYNYPADNPTTIRLPLLPEGFYTPADNTVKVQDINNNVNKADRLYYVSNENLSGIKHVYMFYGSGSINTNTLSPINVWEGDANTGSLTSRHHLVDESELLQYHKTGTGDPTSISGAEAGCIYVNLTTDTAFICVDATPGSQIWKQITS